MYFENCKNIVELKNLYKTLAKKNHPDVGGDENTMKAINAEYDVAFLRIRNGFNRWARAHEKECAYEAPEMFKAIIDRLIKFADLDIEICGWWVWISGNTIAHKAEIKACGCRWSANKKAWYWRQNTYHKLSDEPLSMEQIRSLYGSEKIYNKGANLVKA